MKKSGGTRTVDDTEGISRVETVVLGGYRQKILLEGRRRDNPILITLHGGPGLPVPFCVGSRGLFPEITARYVLVCWDQYGCGINNAVIDDGFTIADFTAMTVDLIRYLKQNFPDNKVFLFGMSWGSILSAQAAVAVPELIDGVLVYGQVLTAPLRSEEALQAIMASKAPEKVKQHAASLISKADMSKEDCMKLSGYIRRYTEGYFNRKEPKLPVGKMMLSLLRNPDYRLKDLVAVVRNGYARNTSLPAAVATVDLRETLQVVRRPYDILQGETDAVTPPGVLLRFLSSCDNAEIRCEVVKNAAHLPGRNGMDAVMRRLLAMAGPELW